MKRIAAATPLALLLLSFGCGDDEPSAAADSSVVTADGSVTKNDGSLPTGEQRLDSGLTPTTDAQTTADAQASSDAGTLAPADGSTDPLDAAVVPPADAEIITVEGDAGTDWILAQQCPASTESDPCYACEDNHCCETFARYRANPEAVAFLECLELCQPAPGASCEEKCAGQHPNGTADVAARGSCLSQFCSSDSLCGEAPDTACTTCGQAKCASQLVAASASESGFLVQACRKACGSDAGCQQACVAEYSQGAGLVVLAGDCIAQQCAAECGSN